MDERLLRILGGEEKFYPFELEDKYPRIFSKIMTLWDKPEMSGYFMELIVPARQGRAGFSPDIAAEIMRLSLVHASSHAPGKVSDIWEISTDKFAIFKPPVSIENASAWKPLPASTAKALQKLGITCSARGFHQATEAGNRHAVALFLEARVNTEITNESGWTPLMMAVFNGHDEVIGLLIRHQADVHACDLFGNTALHCAAEAGRTSSAKLLIENGAEIDARNNYGFTPLLQAATRRHLGVVLQLIDSGANLNSVTCDGWTALHKAAAVGYIEIVRTLLHHGADSSMKNFDGDTPLTLATKNNQQAAIKILMSDSNKRQPNPSVT
ncbi:MAG: ankyrin repeat domain-containing protein [Gallionella sp.]